VLLTPLLAAAVVVVVVVVVNVGRRSYRHVVSLRCISMKPVNGHQKLLALQKCYERLERCRITALVTVVAAVVVVIVLIP